MDSLAAPRRKIDYELYVHAQRQSDLPGAGKLLREAEP